jgi:hypothetical protein
MELQLEEKTQEKYFGYSREKLLKNSKNLYKKEKNNCEIFYKLKRINKILKDDFSFTKLDQDTILAFSLFFWEIKNYRDCLELCL